MNPAEYMLQFFKIEERDDGFDDGISTSFSRMHDAETSDPDERMRTLCQGLSLLAKGFDSMDASMASAAYCLDVLSDKF